MNEGDYFKDGVGRILDLLKDTFGNQFKAYFNGDAEGIPESLLPCIMVSEAEGEIQSGASGSDDIFESILITVALNKKDDLNANQDVQLTEYRVRKLIKGQDPATGQYLPGTVMYALRTHMTMGSVVLKSRMQTNFRPNVRGENTITQEGYVTVFLERLAMVPTRD